MRLKRLSAIATAAVMFAGMSQAAKAACLISTVTSVSTVTANLGTYTAPTAPPVQAIHINVQGLYLVTVGGVLGGCSLSLFFNRPTLPANMTVVGGTATLPYTLQTAASGGNSLLHSGGGIPAASNMMTIVFSPPSILGLGNYSVDFTIYGQMIPGSPQQGGSYNDNLTLTLVGDLLILLPTIAATRAFTVTANVTKTCTIGGVSSPAADNAAIPVNAGLVDTSTILKSYANAACNSPSSLQLTSLNGALTGPTSPGGAFQNQINYTAQAQFSGANAQLNTATLPSSGGPEASLPSAIAGTMPQGTIALSINPHLNALPLARGNYADVLRITLTPN
jgi:hypothetical protein